MNVVLYQIGKASSNFVIPSVRLGKYNQNTIRHSVIAEAGILKLSKQVTRVKKFIKPASAHTLREKSTCQNIWLGLNNRLNKKLFS